jgi:hypothetical protein
MSISLTAMEGVQSDETISLAIIIAGVFIVTLIDSRSSGTFIDYDFDVKLNLAMCNTSTRTVTIAGGGTLLSEAVIQNFPFHYTKGQICYYLQSVAFDRL